MKLIHAYKKIIRQNCIDSGAGKTDKVEYWQDTLFSRTIEIMIPLSMITVIPGVIFSFASQVPIMAILDIVAFLWLLVIGFARLPSVISRKFLFIFFLYFVASYLLLYIGINGPGLLFLFAAAVFALLILPVSYAWWWSWINLAICLIFALILHWDLAPFAIVNEIPVSEWMVVSSNLVFLSFTFSYLLPKLINGLSGSMEKQQQMQLDLYDKNSDLEKYASIISHDLQTPLRTISGFLTLLEKKYGSVLDDKGKEYIHFAVDGSTHLQHIINGLLDFSRAGKYDTGKFELFSLGEIADQVNQLLKSQLEEKKGEITCQPGIFIFSNRVALLQVLHNLAGNALRYSRKEEPPRINISAEEWGDNWRIRVADNGIGMEEENFEKIFIIFQRLHSRTEYEGTGMGLAIVKRIVEKLNGKVWVESTPGAGSTFYFTIPKMKDKL
jgi:signal transduction histidine kinase